MSNFNSNVWKAMFEREMEYCSNLAKAMKEEKILNRLIKKENRINSIKKFFNKYLKTKFKITYPYGNKKVEVKKVKIIGVTKPAIKVKDMER